MNFSRHSFPYLLKNRCPGPVRNRPARLRVMVDEPVEAAVAQDDQRARLQNGSVLILDQQEEARGMLRFCLEKDGYRVSEVATPQEVFGQLENFQPTAVIVDLDSISAGELTFLQRLRGQADCQIIALSNEGSEAEMLCVLDAGASEYLVRPISMAALSARLRVAHRCLPQPTFKAGALTVDLAAHIVKVNERPVSLTPTEFSLLGLFIRHAGKLLTHAQILREIWGPRMVKKREYLRVYLKSLRDKIEADPNQPRLLVTERSIGYRLDVATP
jgi:two-component system, OmpR family, KDP operon response regulator KdpE